MNLYLNARLKKKLKTNFCPRSQTLRINFELTNKNTYVSKRFLFWKFLMNYSMCLISSFVNLKLSRENRNKKIVSKASIFKFS